MIVIIIIAAGIWLLIPAAYFVLLMADAKGLEGKLREPPIEYIEELHEREELLPGFDHAMWTTQPLCHAATAGGEELGSKASSLELTTS